MVQSAGQGLGDFPAVYATRGRCVLGSKLVETHALVRTKWRNSPRNGPSSVSRRRVQTYRLQFSRASEAHAGTRNASDRDWLRCSIHSVSCTLSVSASLFLLCRPHNEMKLKQNSFQTVLKLFCFSQNKTITQPWNVLANHDRRTLPRSLFHEHTLGSAIGLFQLLDHGFGTASRLNCDSPTLLSISSTGR